MFMPKILTCSKDDTPIPPPTPPVQYEKCDKVMCVTISTEVIKCQAITINVGSEKYEEGEHKAYDRLILEIDDRIKVVEEKAIQPEEKEEEEEEVMCVMFDRARFIFNTLIFYRNTSLKSGMMVISLDCVSDS